MKFEELEFKTHPADVLGGIQATKEFPNGFGISIIRTFFSYGGEKGLYELAVLKDGHLHYDNPVADGDVQGHLTEEEVEKLGTEVEQFKEVNHEAPLATD